MALQMFKRLLLILCALLLPSPALANDLEGAWALKIDDATIFRFDLREIADGVWRGTWTRPVSFGTNGAVFSQLEGERALTSMAGLELNGVVELSFDDPRPGAVPDIFRFRLTGERQAELIYVGTRLAPFPLVQTAPNTPLGPFAEDRVYDRDNAATVSDYDPEPPELVAAQEPLELDELIFAEEPVAEPVDEPVAEPMAPPIDDPVDNGQQSEETGVWPPPEWSIEVWDDEPELGPELVEEVPATATIASPEPDAEPAAEEDATPSEPAPSLIGDDFLDGL